MREERGRLVGGRTIACKSAVQLHINNHLTFSPNPQNNDDAKVILASAVQHVGQSVKIWLAAADLEHDVKAKKRVLRKGRYYSPLTCSNADVVLQLLNIFPILFVSGRRQSISNPPPPMLASSFPVPSKLSPSLSNCGSHSHASRHQTRRRPCSTKRARRSPPAMRSG